MPKCFTICTLREVLSSLLCSSDSKDSLQASIVEGFQSLDSIPLGCPCFRATQKHSENSLVATHFTSIHGLIPSTPLSPATSNLIIIVFIVLKVSPHFFRRSSSYMCCNLQLLFVLVPQHLNHQQIVTQGLQL